MALLLIFALAGADPPPTQQPTGSPAQAPALPNQVVILNDVKDFGEFLNRLKQPDLIIIRPSGSTTTPALAGSMHRQQEARNHAIAAVKLHGLSTRDAAAMEMELDVQLLVPGSAWVPIRLDGQVITSAREGEREVELRVVGRDQWEARLEGQRSHALRIGFQSLLKTTLDRRQLQVAIPEAASTYIQLDVEGAVSAAALGSGEVIGRGPRPAGKGTRLSAFLSPRSQLSLEWSDESSAGSQLNPMLATQSEIALEVDAETITTRTSCSIRAIRGVAHHLEIQLDPEDIISKLQLDGQFLVAGIERNILTVPLPEPLRPGTVKNLVMETRRHLGPSSPRAYQFSGFPVAHSGEQSGFIGLTQAADLWVNVNQAHGLRRIDPRELPTDLRARPGTGIAFQFLDQPFKLDLGVKASPPAFRSSVASELTIESDQVINDTTIEFQRIRGRLFEVEIAIPSELQLISVGPPELVRSVTPTDEGPQPTQATNKAAARAQNFKINLTATGRDQRSITLKVRGLQRIGGDGEVNLGLLAARGSLSSTTSVAVFTDRTLTFEAADESIPGLSSFPPVFQVQRPDPRATSDPFRPSRTPTVALSSTRNPMTLRGRIVRHPVSIQHETQIAASVSRDGIDARQETRLRVRHGSIRELPIRVPASCENSWEVQGSMEIKREDQGIDSAGSRTYLLRFDPPITDRGTITFKYRKPFVLAAGSSGKLEDAISWIRFGGGDCRSVSIEVSEGPGILLTADDPQWIGDTGTGNAAPADTGLRRYRASRPELQASVMSFSARLLDEVELPSLVVPRALLRSVVGFDNVARTQVWYWVETRPSHMTFRLPERSSLVRARIDGRAAEQTEFDPREAAYRLSFPSDSRAGGSLVELEYQVSGDASRSPGGFPELLEGAIVQQTLWELHIPWNLALIGVPSGWVDENQWYWDTYVWKRKPTMTLSRLVSWVSMNLNQANNLAEVLDEDPADVHGYLFSRTGPPIPLHAWITSRAWIVGASSGSVLLAWFLAMLARRRFRLVWGAVAVVALSILAFAHPVSILQYLESAVSGVVLVLLGILIQRLLERSGGHTPAVSSTSSSPGAPAASSPSGIGIGSDDSTAVRGRASSTMDHVPAHMVLAPDPPSAGRSSAERAG